MPIRVRLPLSGVDALIPEETLCEPIPEDLDPSFPAVELHPLRDVHTPGRLEYRGRDGAPRLWPIRGYEVGGEVEPGELLLLRTQERDAQGRALWWGVEVVGLEEWRS